jgi:hypothetical protein
MKRFLWKHAIRLADSETGSGNCTASDFDNAATLQFRQLTDSLARPINNVKHV